MFRIFEDATCTVPFQFRKLRPIDFESPRIKKLLRSRNETLNEEPLLRFSNMLHLRCYSPSAANRDHLVIC